MQSFLESVEPPLKDIEYISSQFKKHDIQYDDLPDISANHLMKCGVSQCGTQIHILRAIKNTFSHNPTANHTRRRNSVNYGAVQSNSNISSTSKIDRRRHRTHEHVGLGMSPNTIQSLKSPYIFTISLIATKDCQPYWKKYSSLLGLEILRRIELTFKQLPFISFELPCLFNMLLFHPNSEGDDKNDDKKMDLLSITETNVVARLLPKHYDTNYAMFHHASHYDIETLVLVFDHDLLGAYSSNPKQLALAISETVAVRMEEHRLFRDDLRR
jgi:hypothetical protein